nr:MAG TPA: hypothetical protein [Caudoviricetes sp.]
MDLVSNDITSMHKGESILSPLCLSFLICLS